MDYFVCGGEGEGREGYGTACTSQQDLFLSQQPRAVDVSISILQIKMPRQCTLRELDTAKEPVNRKCKM